MKKLQLLGILLLMVKFFYAQQICPTLKVKNKDIVELFDLVPEGTLVDIQE